jgi:hypothetical protein
MLLLDVPDFLFVLFLDLDFLDFVLGELGPDLGQVFFQTFNGLFVLGQKLMLDAFVFFDLLNEFFVLVFYTIELL